MEKFLGHGSLIYFSPNWNIFSRFRVISKIKRSVFSDAVIPPRSNTNGNNHVNQIYINIDSGKDQECEHFQSIIIRAALGDTKKT